MIDVGKPVKVRWPGHPTDGWIGTAVGPAFAHRGMVVVRFEGQDSRPYFESQLVEVVRVASWVEVDELTPPEIWTRAESNPDNFQTATGALKR